METAESDLGSTGQSQVETSGRLCDRTAEIFAQQKQQVYERTDRLFAALMLVQWVGAILGALVISPRAWAGVVSDTHIHVWAAIFLAGAIISLPVYLALFQPGKPVTRHVIAGGQMLMSVL